MDYHRVYLYPDIMRHIRERKIKMDGLRDLHSVFYMFQLDAPELDVLLKLPRVTILPVCQASRHMA
jgi:hypothetical protein